MPRVSRGFLDSNFNSDEPGLLRLGDCTAFRVLEWQEPVRGLSTKFFRLKDAQRIGRELAELDAIKVVVLRQKRALDLSGYRLKLRKKLL